MTTALFLSIIMKDMLEKIDLLKYHKKRHRKKKIAIVSAAIIFLIFGSVFLSFKVFYASKKLNENMGFFKSLSHLILSSDRELAAGKGNINILILGIGGPGHDGPYLTDTMLVASVNKKDNKIAMISIPRDLLIDTYKFGKQKINAINAYAEAANAGGGAKFTRDVVQELLQIPVNYYVRIDFSAFKDLVDAVNGIDINVPNAFTDSLYPVGETAQTTTVSFASGPQHMDGAAALVYARSRHGNNNEGSDFARSRRQEQIILALKNKVLTAGTLLSPEKLTEIYKILKEHIDTNINVWEAAQLANTYRNMNLAPGNIAMNVLEAGPDAPLYATYYGNQYVLLPKKADFSDLRAIAADPWNAEAKKYIGSYKDAAGISVAILNGTDVAGMAALEAQALSDLGYKIQSTGNAPAKNFEKNVIYNLTPRDKNDALQNLKSVLQANVAQSVPAWLKDAVGAASQPDFVVVIGAGGEPQS